ncbi:hypothetical protein FQA39_LY13833 [Lamprigera yunnana]|nr:hypothetical protein FQA39_LY13833 [Lamprigera yunnana]
MEPKDLVKPAVLKTFKDMLKNMNIENYTISITSATEKSQNFCGIIAQVKVIQRDSGMEHNFIIKSAPHMQEFRKLVFVEDTFKREIYIYFKLLDEFLKIQQNKNIITIFDSYPKYYISSEKYNEEFIVLQNMLTDGYKHCERTADFDHTLLTVRELGKFHALSYVIRRQQPKLFEDIISDTQEIFFKNFGTECLRLTVQHRTQKALQALDPVVDKVVYEKFKKYTENVFEIIGDCINSKNADQYAVVNHGDCTLNNFLFKYQNSDNSSSLTRICFLDWQLSRLGSPALDLSSFIFTSVDKETRDQYYHYFVKEYYDSLCYMLKQFGEDGLKVLPMTDLEHQLKQFSIYGVFMAYMVLYLQLSEAEEIPDILTTKAKPKDFIFEMEDAVEYNTRIRDIILFCNSLDYDFY